jgi:hypothetical protein
VSKSKCGGLLAEHTWKVKGVSKAFATIGVQEGKPSGTTDSEDCTEAAFSLDQ